MNLLLDDRTQIVVQTLTTISVGGAVWMPGEDREAVLRRADNALYQAKQRGCNCIVV